MDIKEFINGHYKEEEQEYLFLSCPCGNHDMIIHTETGLCSCFLCGFESIPLVDAYSLFYPETEAVRILLEKFMLFNDMYAEYEAFVKEKQYNQDIVFEINHIAMGYFKEQLKKNIGAQKYIKSRQIESDNIGYAPYKGLYLYLSEFYTDQEIMATGLIGKKDNGEIYDFFRNRIMFPIIENGNIHGFGGRVFNANDTSCKYLNGRATEIFKKKELLFGYDDIPDNADNIFICEGYVDVITLKNHGFNAVCSMGTALSELQIKKLLKKSNNIILLFDGDTAGRNAAKKVLLKHNHDISVAFLPDNLDPDEYLKQHGARRFSEFIESNRLKRLDFLDNYEERLFL